MSFLVSIGGYSNGFIDLRREMQFWLALDLESKDTTIEESDESFKAN
jgi:hypothetical protein